MIAKFSFYDLIAAVIPGILFPWGISLLIDGLNIPLAGGLAETSVLMALAYVILPQVFVVNTDV